MVTKSHDALVKSLQDKYGMDITNVSQLPGISEKKRNTINKTIKENPNYGREHQEKINKSLEEKHGPDYKSFLVKSIQDGQRNKYDGKLFIQTDESREYRRNLELNLSSSDRELRIKKSKQTKLKTHGDENFINKDEIAQTNMRKFGSKSPMGNEKVKEKSKNTIHVKILSKLLTLFTKLNLELISEGYENAHSKLDIRCISCGFKFVQSWNAIQQGFTCPNCRESTDGSKSQKEICEYISNLGFSSLSYNNRALIKPWELDIVIPDKKIAIEYCGLRFHNIKILEDTRTSLPNPKLYHLMKLELCSKKGYKLITIFEDEWVFKNEIVKNRLRYILGKSNGIKIRPNKCIIKEIDPDVKNNFLEEFHIQGKDSSNIKLGAFIDDVLISVMTFSKPNISKGRTCDSDRIWELNRFCSHSNYIIPGIAGKLLSYFKKNYKWDVIFSYADRRWSDGNLYLKLGFSLEKITSVNYWYIDYKAIKRIHRFALRKKKDDPKDVPEWILRLNEGYKIIYDCGSYKFLMKSNPSI